MIYLNSILIEGVVTEKGTNGFSLVHNEAQYIIEVLDLVEVQRLEKIPEGTKVRVIGSLKQFVRNTYILAEHVEIK